MDTTLGVSQQPRSQSPRPTATPNGDPAAASPDQAGGTLGRDQFVPSQNLAAKPLTAVKTPPKKTLTDQVEDSVLYRNYSQGANLDPIRGAGVGFNVQVHLISPEDGLLTSDPNRAHAIAVMKAAGQSATWADVRGVFRPHAGLGFSAPVGPVDAHVGAWADSEVGWSVLAPYAKSWSSVEEAGKNMSVDFPLGADKARQLVEGSEAVIQGRGRLGAGVGVGYHPVGTSLPGGFGVGASVSVDQSTYEQAELSIRVKRLYGDKVHVMISRVDTTGHDTTGSVQAGVTVPLDKHVQAGLANAAARWVDKQVESWLKFDARAVYSRSDSERAVTAYVLDLSDPEAAKAYERLLRLDTQPAETLAAKPDGSVTKATLEETTSSTREGEEAKLLKVTMLSDYTTRSRSTGTLESPRGKFDYQLSTLDRTHEDIITRWWKGRIDTKREFIETTGRSDVLPGRLYHVRYEANVDGNTPSSAVQRFLTTTGYLLGKEPVDKALAADPELLNRFWRSRLTMDVGFKQDGVQRLMAATPDELQKAYAEAYEELDRPWDGGFLGSSKAWRVTPWLNVSDPDYREVMQILAQGKDNASDHQDGQQSRTDRYWQLTGRSLSDDVEAYQESQHLVSLFQALGKASNSRERADLLEKAQGFELDPLRELGMVAKIAGRDSVVVKELAIRDRSSKKDLVFKAFGSVGDPRDEVTQGLSMPEQSIAKP